MRYGGRVIWDKGCILGRPPPVPQFDFGGKLLIELSPIIETLHQLLAHLPLLFVEGSKLSRDSLGAFEAALAFGFTATADCAVNRAKAQ